MFESTQSEFEAYRVAGKSCHEETGLVSGFTPGYLTIDLVALQRNYLALASRLGATATAAGVKTDAYGLGADRVAPVL